MKNKSRLLKLLLVGSLLISLIACSNDQASGGPSDPVMEDRQDDQVLDEPTDGQDQGLQGDLIVFAAASMTESLEEIQVLFEDLHPDVSIQYNFDSSGTLQSQIEEGAQADVFLSAAQKQMDALEEGGYIYSDSRRDLLENKVVLAVPQGNPKNIESFDDLDKAETIALGNEDVPVGQYSEEILKNLGIFEQIQPRVTYGSNVKEVTTWLDEAVVDCGIIYATDAKAAGLQVVDQAGPDLIETPVVYPIARLVEGPNQEAAIGFIDFLYTDEAIEILKSAGFSFLR